MAPENRPRDAERIHGELLELGQFVASAAKAEALAEV
jgi:hypothetical protein